MPLLATSVTDRYAQLLSSQGKATYRIAGNLWTIHQRMAVAVGPPSVDFTIERQDAEKLLRDSRALLVRWTNGMDVAADSPWYSVICDRSVPLDKVDSKVRSGIRRGLKTCEVKKIDAKTIALHGYDVYLAAHQRYRNNVTRVVSAREFADAAEADACFPDLIEYVGVYGDAKLIGYARNRIYGSIGVDYDVIKLAPDGMKNYSSYALIHWMNEHYLAERRFPLVNDGFRSLLHDTHFQDFLIQKFGFRRTPQRLSILYQPWVGALIHCLYPARNLIGRCAGSVRALMDQESIRRSCLLPAAACSPQYTAAL